LNKKKAAEWVAAHVWINKYPDAPGVLKQVALEKCGRALKGAMPAKQSINFSMLPKKERPKPYKQLMRLAWSLFSEHVRQRDTFDGINCRCCTCPVVKRWRDMQAGHYQSTVYESTKFDEENVHAQCRACNMPPNPGEPEKYALFMDERYGAGAAEKMRNKARRRIISRDELQKIIAKYGPGST
jgi:hypothetical protein